MHFLKFELFLSLCSLVLLVAFVYLVYDLLLLCVVAAAVGFYCI